MQIYQAAKYIRLSYSDDKSVESDSISNQRNFIDDFISRNPDIQAVSEKIDDGYSGVVFDRPAFQEMLQDAKEGKINCIIVKDLSRLGREYIETGRFLRKVFPAYGVRFIAINDNIDTANETSGDDLHVSVKNIMNDAYCRDISIKTRTSLDIKRKTGDFVGAFTIYGYVKSQINKNKLEVDPSAALIVKEIYRMRLEGTSALGIATHLNSLCIPSPLAYKKNNGLPYASGGYADITDCQWSATTVIRILQDETYTGVLVQGKQGTPHFKLRELQDKPESEWIRVEDTHEAIISKYDFNLVQSIRQLDTRTSPNKGKVYLFSGMLICGSCGGRMTRKTNRRDGKEYIYYYCPTGKKNGCLTPTMVKENELINCVRDSLKKHIDTVVSLGTMIANSDHERINQELVAGYSAQIIENERRLSQIEDFKSKLYENLVGEILSREEFVSFKNRYNIEIEQIQKAISALCKNRSDVLENRGDRNHWIEHFKSFSTLETLDRKAVSQLIKSIHLKGKHELEINYRYKDEYKKALSMLTSTEIREVG